MLSVSACNKYCTVEDDEIVLQVFGHKLKDKNFLVPDEKSDGIRKDVQIYSLSALTPNIKQSNGQVMDTPTFL